jgi:hypothetical protein
LVSSTTYIYVLPKIVSVQKKPNPKAFKAEINPVRVAV